MPFGGVGVKYNIKPWVRLGLNLEYDMLRSTDKGMLSTTTNRDYEIKDPSTGKTILRPWRPRWTDSRTAIPCSTPWPT